jgi:polysaccharide export outer membrane protein
VVILFAPLVVTICLTAGLPVTGAAQERSEPQVILVPGDAVRLKIWREPDLSGDVQVNEDGEAVFPRLGHVRVADIGMDSLETLLVARYAVFLKDPVIDITPLRRISILGAVKNPGLYPIDPTVKLGDAIALAGGATPVGDQNKIQLMRGGKKIDIKLSRDLTVMQSPVRSGDQLFVPERSWISRNPGIVAAAITASAVIAATLLR